MRIAFRQGIVRHQTDLSNNPIFLNLVGNSVNLVVSPDPTIVTIAHGTSNYLITESTTVPDAWSVLGGVNKWLFVDVDLVTGIRSFGTTDISPVKMVTPPLSPVLDQHWFDLATTTMKVWNGYKWVEFVRVFIAKFDVLANQLISTSINSPLFVGTQVGLLTDITAGSLMFDSSSKPLKSSLGKFHTTEDSFLVGVPTGTRVRIQALITEGKAQLPMSKYTAVKFIDFGKIIPADAFDAPNIVHGIIEEDVTTGEVVNISFSGVISNGDWDWQTVNVPVFVGPGGELVLSPLNPLQLPFGHIITPTSIMVK